MKLVIALIVWAGAIAGGVAVSHVVASNIHTNGTSANASSAGGGSGTGTAGTGTSSGGSSAPAAPFDPSSVKSTSAQSLFVAANLSKALKLAKAKLAPNAKVTITALYPGYVVVEASKGGVGQNIDVEANGSVSVTSGGSAGGLPSYPLSKVKATAPAALLKRISSVARVPASQIHYMVAESDPISHQFRWLVYPNDGNKVEYFSGAGATGPLFELKANSSSGPKQIAG